VKIAKTDCKDKATDLFEGFRAKMRESEKKLFNRKYLQNSLSIENNDDNSMLT
jgi:hypothetical protein